MTAPPSLPTLPAGFRARRELARARAAIVLEAERDGEVVSLRLEPGAAPEARAELAVLAQVRHPGLARLVEHGPLEGGGAYLARAWVDGEPLTALRGEHERVGRVVARACDALEHLHRRGFLHGDLKPDNVLVGADDAPVLIDFGFSQAIDDAGRSGGSWLHVPPELLLGQTPDARSDLFSLGVLLLRLLHDAPLDARTLYGRFPAEPFLVAAGIDAATLPEWARDLVPALLERDPTRRPSSAGIVGRTLRARLRFAPDAAPEGGGDARARLTWPAWGGREGALAEALKPGARVERWTTLAGEDCAGLAREAALAAALTGVRVRTADLDADTRELMTPRARAAWVRGMLEGGPDALAIVHGSAAEQVARTALAWLDRGARRASSARLIWIAAADSASLAGAVERSVPAVSEAGVRAVLTELLGDDARLDDLAARLHAESAGVAAELQVLLDGVEARGWIHVEAHGPHLRAGALPDWLGRGRGQQRAETSDLSDVARAVDEVLTVLRGPATSAELAQLLDCDADASARAVAELAACGRVQRAGPHRWRRSARVRRPALDEDRRRDLHARAADALPAGAESAAHAWLATPGRATEERLRAALSVTRDEGELDRALDVLGWLEHEAGSLPDVLRGEFALTCAHTEDTTRARAVCAELEETRDARARSLCERALGQVARLEQRHDDALEHLARAARDDPQASDDALVARARLLFEGGRYAELDALAAEVGVDGPRRCARNVHGLVAVSLVARGRSEEARALLAGELERAVAANDGALEAATRVNLAIAARRAGDAATASAELTRARELHQSAGRLHGLAQCDALLGALARDAGELAEAARRLDRALEARELLGDAGGVLAVRGSLALVHAARGHASAALVELEALSGPVRAAGRGAEADLMDAERCALHARLGWLHAPALAEACARADLEREPRAGLALARAAWMMGDTERAAALLEGARAIAARMGRGAVEREAEAALAALAGDDADETSAALAEPFDEERAGALAELHFRRGGDDHAARLWLALARRSQDEAVRRGARARATEMLGELERGLGPDDAAHLRTMLLARPDPHPADLNGIHDEEQDMDVLSILEINRKLVDQQELGPLLGSIVENALMLTGAERGFLILCEDGELSFDLAMDSRRGDIEAPEVELSHSVVREALRSGGALRVSDASDDPLLGAAPSVATLELRSILCHAFDVEPGVQGVIYLDHRGRAGAFGPRAERLIGLLADQAALAIRQVRRVAEIRSLNARLAEEVVERDTDLVVARRALADKGVAAPVAGLIGETPAMRAVHALLRRVAPSALSVLVSGDSGTGKELAARALHELSPRVQGPFVSESCAALPATLIESELFGYRKGSFTGAEHDRAGLFERASGGTLFLDEVGELPLELQAKLLRVLETREVRRLGETETRPVDFRLVAATNRDLAAEVEADRFRLDLLYRLDTVRVVMPPLAERIEDLPLLVDHFLRLEEQRGGRRQRCSDAVLARLAARPWPGNVRELRNEVARLCVLSEGDIEDPTLVRTASAVQATSATNATGAVRPLAELEKEAILGALERAGGDKRRAAEMLGVSRAKIYQRLKEWREDAD